MRFSSEFTAEIISKTLAFQNQFAEKSAVSTVSSFRLPVSISFFLSSFRGIAVSSMGGQQSTKSASSKLVKTDYTS